MNELKKGSTTRLLNTIASMLLFLVFAVCMLFIIGAAAGTYSRISKSYDTTYGSAASIRYISNKIRAADSCDVFQDGSGVILINGSMACVIYYNENGIYEKNVSVDSDINSAGGEMIFEIDAMSIKCLDDVYLITVNVGGSISDVYVRKG